jgi:hypothetical protein
MNHLWLSPHTIERRLQGGVRGINAITPCTLCGGHPRICKEASGRESYPAPSLPASHGVKQCQRIWGPCPDQGDHGRGKLGVVSYANHGRNTGSIGGRRFSRPRKWLALASPLGIKPLIRSQGYAGPPEDHWLSLEFHVVWGTAVGSTAISCQIRGIPKRSSDKML